MPDLGEVPVTEKQRVNGKPNNNHSFQITSGDGEPIDIPAGEYYFNTKARARRMMLNSLSSDARRVYACLELATMGFQQELAVKIERGRKVPLTPADIVHQTELSKQNARRGMAELEVQGLAKRVATDGGDLRNGHILIYSWAEPHEKCKEKGSHARLPLPEWFPKSWEPFKPFIKRLKISLPEKVVALDYLEEGAIVAQDYQKVEKVVRDFFKRVCAQTQPNKDEITERTPERTEERERDVTPKPVAEPKIPPAPPPPPQPSSAIAVQDPEQERRWEFLRHVFKGCGKPVSVMRAAACRAEFFKHPPPVQERIMEDAALRSESVWDKPQFTTAPLKYLQSQIWDTEPIQRRTLPRQPSTRQQESDDVLRRVMERSIVRDRERGGPIR
jgi:hypothetical protein